MKLLFYIPCVLLLQYSSAFKNCEHKRVLKSELNPDCPYEICTLENTKITLIHIEAVGQNDSLHYLWDFGGKPSVLISRTPLNTKLKVDWENFRDNKEKSVSFSIEPIYTFITVFNKIWEYNDVDDIGVLEGINSSQIIGVDVKNFTWSRLDFRNTTDTVEVLVKSVNKIVLLNNTGGVSLRFKTFSSCDHGDQYPHLLHSENATQVDMILDNIAITDKFGSPRFAVEILLVSSELRKDHQSFMVKTRKSLDDEHTPGIFEIIEILSPDSLKAAEGGYLEYRPVSYTTPDRDVSASTETHQGMVTYLDDPIGMLDGTLAWSIYGYFLENLLTQSVNVSFGLRGDGFYARTNYTTWTFLSGYGVPPTEEFSMFVIIVATIGLGIPFLLLAIGGCYICIKRTRNTT